jgi:hypothetical protein
MADGRGSDSSSSASNGFLENEDSSSGGSSSSGIELRTVERVTKKSTTTKKMVQFSSGIEDSESPEDASCKITPMKEQGGEESHASGLSDTKKYRSSSPLRKLSVFLDSYENYLNRRKNCFTFIFACLLLLLYMVEVSMPTGPLLLPNEKVFTKLASRGLAQILSGTSTPVSDLLKNAIVSILKDLDKGPFLEALLIFNQTSPVPSF